MSQCCTEIINEVTECGDYECTCGHGDFLKEFLGEFMSSILEGKPLEVDTDLITVTKEPSSLTKSRKSRVKKLKRKRLIPVRPHTVKLRKGLMAYAEKDCFPEMFKTVSFVTYNNARRLNNSVDDPSVLDKLKSLTAADRIESSRCL